MSTFDQPIRAFLTAAASNAPTPGGGSVAALVAALGASMTSMVSNLTQGAKFADLEASMQEVAGKMEAAIDQFEQLLAQDIASFDQYMAAMKLPKATEEDKAARSQAIQAAAEQATEVPLQLANGCLDALRLSESIAMTANKNVISDLGIAALLLEAAAQSALLTVDINLPGIQSEALRTAFTEHRDLLAANIQKTKDAVVETVRRRLS